MPWTAQGRCWHAALNADRLRVATDGPFFTSCSYEHLAAEARTAVSQEHIIIEKDINRTFPEHAAFQTDVARNKLRRVLGAYACRNTYCQGMSYVAALMLQHLPERDAFWALAALIETFLPSGYYADNLFGAYMNQHVAFAVFLPHLLPRLAAHLDALEFPLTLIGVRWFLCLFAADMEPEATARLWDLLFAHGAHVLFALALGLLSQHEERLLAAPDVPTLFTAVRAIGKSTPSYAKLRDLARGFPSEADVQVARAAYLRVHPPPNAEAEAEDEAEAAPADAPSPAQLPPTAEEAGPTPTVAATDHQAQGSVSGKHACSRLGTASRAGGQGAARTQLRRCLAADLISEALAEVSSHEWAVQQLEGNRRMLKEQAAIGHELRELLGGDAAVEAQRDELLPPNEPIGKRPDLISPSQSFLTDTAAMLAELAPLPQSAGDTASRERGSSQSDAQQPSTKKFFFSAAALLVPTRLLEGLKPRRQRASTRRNVSLEPPSIN
jgi:hypothetical protein